MKKSPMLFAADAVLAVTAPGPDPIPAQPGSAASAVAPETVAAQATATAPAAISSRFNRDLNVDKGSMRLRRCVS
jgi:hypothetical protein